MKFIILALLCCIVSVQGVPITATDIQNLLNPTPTKLFTPCHSFDGVGNNLQNPLWGSNGIPLRRLSPVGYDDGKEEPPRTSISARAVSNEVFSQSKDIPDPLCGSDWLWQWGQFMDHDLDLAPETHEELPIPVPPHETFFVSQETLGFGRSVPADTEAIFMKPARQQINIVTAFVDGSMVYGSNAERALALRTGVGGRLKTSAGGNLPPLNFDSVVNDDVVFDTNVGGFFANAQPGDVPPNEFYLCGDVRCNEQLGLLAVHTLFVREHNRLAELIETADSTLDDNQIYELARKIVIAEIQHITFDEWLPFLLGEYPAYSGYLPDLNPGIFNEFATAAFRMGHSLLSPNLQLRNSAGVTKFLPLRDAFFLGPVTNSMIQQTWRGLAHQRCQALDAKVVDDVRNFLFGDKTTQDLVSLNIQRGRDHGLADYNTMRVAWGGPRKNSFSEITSDVVLQGKLAKVYHNNVDIIDPFVGILAEDPAIFPLGAVSHLGTLGTQIIGLQFQKVELGDRCNFNLVFQGVPNFLDQLRLVTLADVIDSNLGILGDAFGPSAFIVPNCPPIPET